MTVFRKHGIHFKYEVNILQMSVKRRTGELLKLCLHCSFNVAPVQALPLKQLFTYTNLGNQYADYTYYLYILEAAV